MTISRREWLLAAACWAEVLQAQNEHFTWFDSATAPEIKAIACQIIPDDETPGADRAGAIDEPDHARSIRSGRFIIRNNLACDGLNLRGGG